MTEEVRELIFVEPDSICAIEVWKRSESDEEFWEFQFIFQAGEEDMMSVHGNKLFETYQEALLAAYEVSELMGYNSVFSEIAIMDWDNNGDPVTVNIVSLSELESWYNGEVCPFCGEECIHETEIDENRVIH